jgi:hypothetical protein
MDRVSLHYRGGYREWSSDRGRVGSGYANRRDLDSVWQSSAIKEETMKDVECVITTTDGVGRRFPYSAFVSFGEMSGMIQVSVKGIVLWAFPVSRFKELCLVHKNSNRYVEPEEVQDE